MKKYLAAFVVGFGAGVLHVVPVAKSLTCCLIIPLASFIAILLDQRANKITGVFPTRRGVILGVLTGLYAAIFGTAFDSLITIITKTNDIVVSLPELLNMINQFPVNETIKEEVSSLFNTIAEQIKTTGFSALYTISIFVNNLIVDVLFGLIGGLIGVKIINSRSQNNPNQ